MTAEEFVRRVMEALSVESPGALADALDWPRGKERTISRWLAGETKPSYMNVIDMVERAGLLSRAEGHREVAAAPDDPQAKLAAAVVGLTKGQTRILSELKALRAAREAPPARPQAHPKRKETG